MLSSTFQSDPTCQRHSQRFSFHSFGDHGFPINLTSSFRENIRMLVQQCTTTQENVLHPFINLFHQRTLSDHRLYIIEENVGCPSSPWSCQHCIFAHWGDHVVSRRRFHLIIPMDNDWNKPLDDGWNKPLDNGVFDFHSFILYGVVHSNGYGHLITINGIEGGSKHLTGREVMNFWDRICSYFRTRKISLRDTSIKRSMDIRLLHAVAYENPWFAKWGYRFCRGSFCVTKDRYEAAVKHLRLLQVDESFDTFSAEMKEAISHYSEISDAKLTCFKDLIQYILSSRPLNAQLAGSSNKCQQFSYVASKFTDHVKFVEAAEEIVKVLKEAHLPMAWNDVREALQVRSVTNLGLLDKVLMLMNNAIVGNRIVSANWNSTTDGNYQYEYTLHERAGLDVYRDLSIIYSSVFLADANYWAAQDILDCKNFVKDYEMLSSESEDQLKTLSIRFSNVGFLDEQRECPPGVLVQLPVTSTVGEFKALVENSMRETYCLTEFTVMGIEELNHMEDGEMVLDCLQNRREVYVTGMDIRPLKYQAGIMKSARVDCLCGTQQADGEQMFVCASCNVVWQHTRCRLNNDGEDTQFCLHCQYSVPPHNENL